MPLSTAEVGRTTANRQAIISCGYRCTCCTPSLMEKQRRQRQKVPVESLHFVLHTPPRNYHIQSLPISPPIVTINLDCGDNWRLRLCARGASTPVVSDRESVRNCKMLFRGSTFHFSQSREGGERNEEPRAWSRGSSSM